MVTHIAGGAVCRPSDLGPNEIKRWEEIAAGSAAVRHPFLSPQFALAVGEVAPRARVAVLRSGGRPVGFLPFEAGPLRVARPLAGRAGYRQGFVHDADVSWTWDEVMRAAELNAIEFTDLIGSQVDDRGSFQVTNAPIIDTSQGWDAYLEASKGRRMKNTRYLDRKLGRDVGPVTWTWGAADPGDFKQLIAWKSEQYRRSGWADPFAQRWMRDLLDILVEEQTGPLRAVFTSLRAGDHLLAVDLSLLYYDVYAGWFAAYNPEFSNYSPGAVRMLHTIESACAEQVRYIDLASGDERYKRSFKNAYVEVGRGLVAQRSASSALYRAARAPVHAGRAFVLERPRVRAFVRSTLRRVGTVRTTVFPNRHAPPS